MSPLESQQDSWELGWVIAQRTLFLPKKGSPPGKTQTPAIVNWEKQRGPRVKTTRISFSLEMGEERS